MVTGRKIGFKKYVRLREILQFSLCDKHLQWVSTSIQPCFVYFHRLIFLLLRFMPGGR